MRVGAIQFWARIEHLIAKAVADVQQNCMFGRQLIRRNRLSLRPLVAQRNDDLKRLFVQKIGDDTGRLERQRDNRRIDLSGPKRRFEVLGQVLLDVERHLRRPGVQRRN